MDHSQIHLLADEELMRFVERADPDAFAVVYDRHAGAAFSLAYRICGTRNGAEDATQEAFLSIWRGGGRYRSDRGSVRTWILSVVHHRAIDYLRRHSVHDRRRATVPDGFEERLESRELTDVEALRREQARSVRAAIEALPAEQSRVIELAYFGGFTHTEIADLLETPVGTIKGRMRLGLDKLRISLEAEGGRV